MQDILDRLEAELATAPDPTFDLATTIASGRRAVRRRRVAAGGAALAAVVAIAGTAWAVGPDGTTGGRDGGAAGDPTSSATAQPAPEPWGEVELLRFPTEGGPADVNPAAVVVTVRPYTATDGTNAEVFRLRYRGDEYYAVAADGDTAWVRLPVQGMTLSEWAEGQLTQEKGDAVEADWVTIDARSRLTPEPGVRIVEQRADPGLGESFAAPSDPTAVAEVVVDGTTYFLVVRAAEGGATDVIPYREDETITSLDAFVSFSRERYATNEQGGSEGLR